jgi:prevent-host-death family protein
MASRTKATSGRREIPVSEFKMRCLRLVDEVNEKGGEIVITKRGRPVARVTRVPDARNAPTLGRWKSVVRIKGDIVHSDWSEEFDATRRR